MKFFGWLFRPRKVWIVTYGHYADRELLAVCSSKRKAEEIWEWWDKNRGIHDRANRIEERIMDIPRVIV